MMNLLIFETVRIVEQKNCEIEEKKNKLNILVTTSEILQMVTYKIV